MPEIILEQKYFGKLIGDLDKPDSSRILGSNISFMTVKDLGETYFFLEAEKLKEKVQEDAREALLDNPEYDTPEDLLTVFQCSTRMIIAGEPGAGKSTSLMYLAMLLTANYACKHDSDNMEQIKASLHPFVHKLENSSIPKPYVPLFIRLKDISTEDLEDRSFLDLLVQHVNKILPDDDVRDLVVDWEIQDRLCILLDGLDEMGQGRNDFLDKLFDYINNNYNNSIILSSRPTDDPYAKVQKKSTNNPEWMLSLYQLMPLKDNDAAKKFASKWLGNLGVRDPDLKAKLLIDAVITNGGFIKVIRNPLLLRMMIHIYSQDKYKTSSLPVSRVQLYERYIREVILERAGLQYYTENNRFSSMMKILEYIAWFIHGKNEALYKDDLIEKLEPYIPKDVNLEEWFDRFTTKMRLLYKHSDEEKVKYEFSHQSFQEYFVARRLLAIYRGRIGGKRWAFKKVIEQISWSAHYQEIIIMFLKELSLDLQVSGKTKQAHNLYRKLPADSRIGFLELFNERILDPIEPLSSKDKPIYEETPSRSISDTRDSSAVPALLKVLLDKDANDRVRSSSATALGEIGDSSAVPALLEVFLDKAAYDGVRGYAADALGWLGDSFAVPALLEVLLDKDANDRVRSSSATALGRLGDSSAVPALLEVLLDKDDEDWVRGSSATALGRLGDSSAFPALLEVFLDKDDEDWVRSSSATALGEIGDSSAVPALIEVLLDKAADDEVRRYAAAALGRIGGEIDIEALKQKFKDKGTQKLAREVLDSIRILPVLPDPKLPEKLIKQIFVKLRSMIYSSLSSIIAGIVSLLILFGKNIFTEDVICRAAPYFCDYTQVDHPLRSIGFFILLILACGLFIDVLRNRK